MSVINTASQSVTTTIASGTTPIGFGNFISTYPVITVGQNENNQAPLICMISPNPFSFNTQLTFNQSIENANLILMDYLGHKVRTISFSGNQYTIDKEGLSAGIYFIQVCKRGEVLATKKVVIE